MGSAAVVAAPRRLTVVYDETCELCRRCHHWLSQQPTYVPLDFLPAGSAQARARYGDLPWLATELVVVSEEGAAWVVPAAFVMCLWATREWREWSYRLTGGVFAPLAQRLFHHLTARRGAISGMLRESPCDDACGLADEQQ